MEVAENNAVETKMQRAKRKTIKIKEDVGYFISESPLFKSLKGKAQLYFQNPEKLTEEITSFYNNATGEEGRKSLSDIWKKMQKLFFMVRDSLTNKYQELPKAKVAIGIAVILYVIMPVDLVPDVLPVFGFADDAALIAWFMRHAAKEVKQYESWAGSGTQGQVQTAY